MDSPRARTRSHRRPEDLKALGTFINQLGNVEKFEILPYHQLGVHKWEALGVPYALNDVEPRQMKM